MALARRHHAWNDDLAISPSSVQFGFDYEGTPGDDRVKGSTIGDDIDVSQGGDDRVSARGGDDTVYFGVAFTGADRVDGGKGFDVVTLDGDYAAGIAMQADCFDRVEKLVLEGGPYVITGQLNIQDAEGRTWVDATSLMPSQHLYLSIAAPNELYIQSGAGDDVLDASGQVSRNAGYLFGNGGDDVLMGGAGEYNLYGGYGADRIVSNSDETQILYVETIDSTRKQFDTIEHFQGRLRFFFESDTSTSTIDHNFHLGKTADHAGDILFKYDAGKDETIVKVFTDHDKTADFVLHLTGDVQLTTGDFIFG